MARSETTAAAESAEASNRSQKEAIEALGRAIVDALGDAGPARQRPPRNQDANAAATEYGRIRRALRTHLEKPAVAPPTDSKYQMG